MNENERNLLSDLRALAESDRSQASADLQARLLIEYRRHAARKRRMGWLQPAGIGAIAAALLLFGWLGKGILQHRAAPPAIATNLSQPVLPIADETDAGFYPLPEAEGLPPIENATVVRVQMPLASLQLMGIDLNETGVAEPIQADILLGQDGLARGVRLVQ